MKVHDDPQKAASINIVDTRARKRTARRKHAAQTVIVDVAAAAGAAAHLCSAHALDHLPLMYLQRSGGHKLVDLVVINRQHLGCVCVCGGGGGGGGNVQMDGVSIDNM